MVRWEVVVVAWMVWVLACGSVPLVGADPTEPVAEPVVVPKSAPPVEVVTTPVTPGTSTVDLQEGTVEYAIRSSLLLLRDGKVDQWVADWCHADACTDANAIESMKRFGLKRAVGNAAACLHGEDARIRVTTKQGDEAAGPLKVFVECGTRMPVPSTHVLVDGRWRVTSFSW